MHAGEPGEGIARTAMALEAPPTESTNMLTILVILLVLALIGGGLGHSRFGYAGWSPAGLLLLVVFVELLTRTTQ
jgi:hypothetical protein